MQSKDVTSRISLFLLCFLGSVLGGAVSTLMSVYLPVVVREMRGPMEEASFNEISAYINAIFIVGWTLGGFTWGMIADALGRKKSLLFTLACFGLAALLTGYMKSWEGLVVCRFISGFGVGGLLVVSFTYMTESWPPNSRAIYIGILSIGFPVGIFSAGLVNYLVPSWREGFMIGLIPLLLVLAGSFLLNEPVTSDVDSPVRGRSSLAVFREIETRNALAMGAITFGTMLIGLWAIFLWLPTWIQTLLPDAESGTERGLSMMLLGIGGLSGGFFSGWVGKMMGVRRAMLVCFSICAIMSFILFRTNPGFSNVIFVEIGLMALAFGVSQGILSAYIPQLFPKEIRATATGLCFNLGRLFTAIAVLFVGLLVSRLGGYANALFTFSLVFLIGLVSLLIYRPVLTTSQTSKPD